MQSATKNQNYSSGIYKVIRKEIKLFENDATIFENVRSSSFLS